MAKRGTEMYRSAFTEADLIDSATVNVIAGQFVKLGEYQVQAGEMISTGYGEQSGQDSAQGRIFMKFQTATPTEIKGMVRLQAYSPQDRPIEIIGEWRTELLNTNATDRTKQLPLPEHIVALTEDKKFVLEFKADADAALDKANSTIIMDITRYTV